MVDLLIMGDHPAALLSGSINTAGVDTETTGLTWADKVLGISLAWREGEEYKSCYLLDPSGTKQLPMWGASGTVSSVVVSEAINKLRVAAFANHSFDYRFMMKEYGLSPLPNVVDVQLVAKCIGPQSFGLSLEALYGKYVGKNSAEYSAMKAKRKVLSKLDAETVAEYAREDALKTLKLYEAFAIHPNINSYKKNHLWDQKFMHLVMQMVDRGMPLDMDHIFSRIKEYRHRMLELGMKLASQGIANPNYAKDVMGYAASKGIPLANTQVATLEELDLDKYPDLADVIAYRQYSKALGSWLEVFYEYGKEDNRLHSRLNPYGTRSFRMSSEDPNIQGIPMEDRGGRAFGSMFGVFKSNTDDDIYGLDIKQAELRLAATLAKDDDLLGAVSDLSNDPYVNLSYTIWAVPDKRQMAKRAMLSAIYEVGKVKFAESCGISVDEAEIVLKTVRARFPTAMWTAKGMARDTERTGRVDMITGRPRWLQDDEKDHAYKAFNQFVQGGLAEIMRETMLRVESILPGRLLSQVHDSVVLLLSKDKEKRSQQAGAVQECLDGALHDLLGSKYKVAPFPIDMKPYQMVD